LDLAQLLAELGKPDQAKPVIDELVKQQPDNLAALDAQFKIALQINDKSAAKTAADVMVAARPKAALGYFYQGEVAEAEKRFDDALKHYSAALDVQPEAVDPLQAYARVLVKLKRTPEALKRLDDASARYPELPFAANIKGDVLLSIPRPADAELAFRSAIERRPKWWVPYRGLAFAQASLHDEAGAAATLRAGIAIVDQPDALDAQLAGSLENAGKFNEAMQVYEAALLKNPHSDLSANNLAMLLITYKTDRLSLDRAKQLSERFSASPNPEFLDTYGWVLYKRGESEAAIAALQSALSRTPESPVSLYHLGMAQASAGQAAAARDNLARSLKAGKNFYGMGEAKATLDKLATLRPPPDGSGNGLTTAPSPKS
jgi:predicted Zn-dependent protease